MDSLKEDHKEFIKNNKFILKSQQVFKSKKLVFSREVNKIAWSANYDKRIQSISSIETYPYGTSKGLARKKNK